MTASAGVVKWFGGYNNAKGTENKFGFVEGVSGSDVFLHQSQWLGKGKPQEGELLYFELEQRGGKWSGMNAMALSDAPLERLVELLKDIECKSSCSSAYKVKKFIGAQISKSLSSLAEAEFERLVEVLGVEALVNELASQAEWTKNLDLLTEKGLVSPLKDFPWTTLSREYLALHSAEAASYLLALDKSGAKEVLDASEDCLPEDLALFCVLAGLLGGECSGTTFLKVKSYVKKIYSADAKIPEYLRQYIDTEVKPKGGVIKAPIVGPIFSHYQFKKYLYDKDLKFLSLYERSEYLQASIDTFVLAEIFSLVLAGNSLDTVYTLFLGRLWEAITSGKINPEEQVENVLSLFPSCHSIAKRLSCEAVYWEKQKTFLCRGKRCASPRVIGNPSSNFTEFTIYDWFVHYGINYLDDKKPSSRDFPIKLAGYFNRLREIFRIIHCRECSSLLLPDLRYARVEHTVFENGQFIKKSMAPAYRLTIFKCPNADCLEHGSGHYINHCLGFDCYNIIDSRDSKRKCGSGLYICRSCASCCADHAKSNPVGFCPECGSNLNLFDSMVQQEYGERSLRYVKCSNPSCEFGIDSKSLSKRFYLDSCGPVIEEQPEGRFK